MITDFNGKEIVVGSKLHWNGALDPMHIYTCEALLAQGQILISWNNAKGEHVVSGSTFYGKSFFLAEDVEQPKPLKKKKEPYQIKVGDLVEILPVPKDKRVIDFNAGWCDQMEAFQGKQGIVIGLHRTGHIHVQGWYWDRQYIKLIKKGKGPSKAVYPKLYAEAKQLKIPKRSFMTVPQLREAIKEALSHPVNLGIELLRKAPGNPTASYAIQFTDGTRRFEANDVCHARIPFSGDKQSEVFVDNVTCHHRAHKDKEEYKKFLDYMFNRSPWKNTFITKDVDKALEGGVYYDVNIPLSDLACSAIACRVGSEFPIRLNAFKKFKELGCNENQAWFLSQCVRYDGKDFHKTTISGSHDVFIGAMKVEEVISFFNNGFSRNIGASPYSQSSGKRYAIFDSIASLVLYGAKEGSFSEFANKVLQIKVGGKESSNGWEITKTVTDGSVMLFIEEVKKYIH